MHRLRRQVDVDSHQRGRLVLSRDKDAERQQEFQNEAHDRRLPLPGLASARQTRAGLGPRKGRATPGSQLRIAPQVPRSGLRRIQGAARAIAQLWSWRSSAWPPPNPAFDLRGGNAQTGRAVFPHPAFINGLSRASNRSVAVSGTYCTFEGSLKIAAASARQKSTSKPDHSPLSSLIEKPTRSRALRSQRREAHPEPPEGRQDDACSNRGGAADGGRMEAEVRRVKFSVIRHGIRTPFSG